MLTGTDWEADETAEPGSTHYSLGFAVAGYVRDATDVGVEQGLSDLHASLIAVLAGWTPALDGLGEVSEQGAEFRLYDTETGTVYVGGHDVRDVTQESLRRQIATLNGHEAKLSIGQTQYYLEVNNSLVNTAAVQQNLLQAQNWKPVNADLSISIDPQVSGDEQITMTINVKQSTFTARVAPTAPPGTTNRDFQSLVRVKNGDMVMLGGLSENENNQSGSGLPLISRVPVLKWIFGQRTKSKRDDKLTIFIKPTVIYN